ncbi:DUF1178 family protein [Frigidibacter sp. RF13]|uniref:DUF1178 family protein n=1 Tax=Frigidibacter sp. RF13 TaxID=2997340 RepID=UPI00227098A8|nr:DUF1178 family protein [Frigidibacter sp. RF13]MCY1126281.1 DUF1178 family protein [Frigidibacter sp. RF13]
MIRYRLTCDQDHGFESWFKSSDAFDKLNASGMVACSVCGSVKVTKDLMAPAVSQGTEEAKPLQRPASEVEAALAALRRQVEENSEYVGLNFAAEARAMHEGERPHRSIYGEARSDEARKLIEEGVPVAPLPFMPARKVN